MKSLSEEKEKTDGKIKTAESFLECIQMEGKKKFWISKDFGLISSQVLLYARKFGNNM